MIERVKVGDTVVIDGKRYRFGETSTDAFNLYLDCVASGVEIELFPNLEIDLYSVDGMNGDHFPPKKIMEALRTQQ